MQTQGQNHTAQTAWDKAGNAVAKLSMEDLTVAKLVMDDLSVGYGFD